MSFRDEPLKVKIYVIAVVLCSMLFLVFNITDLGFFRNYAFLFFLVLHVLLEHLDVPLPRNQGYVSVSFATSLAMVLLFGPIPAAVASFATIVHKKTFVHYKTKLHRMLFNAGQLSLSTGLAGYAYIWFGGQIGVVNFPSDILPVLYILLTYFLINTFLVMLVISLSQGMSFWGVWVTSFRWSAPNYIATAPLGILIAAVFLNMGIGGVLLLIIPLMVARHTFIMYMDMRNQYMSTIKALTKAIDAKDHYTHGHSERVAEHVVLIAREMRLPEDFVEKLEYLALMHDIGKIGIPEQILNKPSRLSDEEFDLVRTHSAVGAEIISNIKYIGEYSDIVRHHHERIDGGGYPDKLTGDKMSVGAKIVGVADAFDAMTSERIYSNPRSKKEAVAELQRCCNSHFCQDVVAAFVKVLQRKGEIA